MTVGTINKLERPTGLTYNVTYYIVHETEGLAMLRLSSSVQPERSADDLYYKVNFICLPEKSSFNKMQEDATVSGFGFSYKDNNPTTSVLLKANVLIETTDYCRQNTGLDAKWICALGIDGQMTCFVSRFALVSSDQRSVTICYLYCSLLRATLALDWFNMTITERY